MGIPGQSFGTLLANKWPMFLHHPLPIPKQCWFLCLTYVRHNYHCLRRLYHWAEFCLRFQGLLAKSGVTGTPDSPSYILYFHIYDIQSQEKKFRQTCFIISVRGTKELIAVLLLRLNWNMLVHNLRLTPAGSIHRYPLKEKNVCLL